MRRASLVVLSAVVLTAQLGGAPRALAHGAIEGERAANLAALVDQANLVFVGEVVEVAYRQARVEAGEGELPFTLVTYAIREVLRGKAPGKTFTMRFPGGSDGRGHFVAVNGVPVFQAGDQDLLFVAGNGEAGCPLVECEWGRFRIYEGAMYNTQGSPVRGLIEGHAIARGVPPEALRKFSYPAPAFDELLKNPEASKQLEKMGLSVEEARKRYEQEAPKRIEVLAEFPELTAKEGADGGTGSDKIRLEPAAENIKLAAQAVTLAPFRSTLDGVIARTKRTPLPVASIDPKAEIVVRLTPSAPSSPVEAKAIRKGGSAADLAELKAAAAQGFDPVIKKKPQ